jgi:predicted adenine nucleotide alpha hydrolase (AANH) superfamily ATPase
MGKGILLHVCCGPCATYPVKELLERHKTVTGFWYNPNIHPKEEYQKRLKAARDFAVKKGIPLVEEVVFDLQGWIEKMEKALLPQKKEARCQGCYRIRMERTAQKAKEEGYDGFTTTLLYSRYQFHETVKDLGQELASAYGVPFLYVDFRRGWQEGILLSKELSLYRQKYCGCMFSYDEMRMSKMFKDGKEF